MKEQELIKILSCSVCGNDILNNQKDVLSCSSCGAKFSKQKGKIFFHEYAKAWPSPKRHATDATHWSLLRKRNYEFYKQELSVVSENSTILDLGTGEEQFRDLLDQYHRVGIDVVPYDRADIVCDINKRLPFKNNSFDVIVASNVFEHLPDSAGVLKECFRVLKPGGRLLATIPFLLRTHQEPYDFVRYTNFMLEQIMKEAQFSNIVIVPLGTPADLYQTTKLHFFMQLFDYTETKNIFLRAWVKILWNLEKFLSVIGGGIYPKVPPSLGYTLGYAISARKR